MPLQFSWSTQNNWERWTNHQSDGLIRPVNGTMYLPYSRFTTFGIPSTALSSRWSVGQLYTEDATTRLTDQVGPNGIITLNGAADTRPGGMYFAAPSAYGQPSLSFFWDSLLATHSVVSCWFKSTRQDYSDKRGYIWSISRSGSPEIMAGVFVDTDNLIKGLYYSGGLMYTIDPVGGPVAIDDDWHYAIWIYANFGGAETVALFVDEPIDLSNESDLPNRSVTYLGTRHLVIGTNLYDTSQGFVGYVDEFTSCHNVNAGSNFNIDNAIIAPNRFDPQIIVSTVIDTEVDDTHLTGVEMTFENQNSSSIQFSSRSSNSRFSQDNTSLPWNGFGPANLFISGENTDASSLGMLTTGRFQQIRLLIKPSTDTMRLISPEIEEINLSFAMPGKTAGLTETAIGYAKRIDVTASIGS